MLYSTGMHASMADESSINRLRPWSGEPDQATTESDMTTAL